MEAFVHSCSLTVRIWNISVVVIITKATFNLGKIIFAFVDMGTLRFRIPSFCS